MTPALPELALLTACILGATALVAALPTLPARGRFVIPVAVGLSLLIVAPTLYDFDNAQWQIELDPSEEPMLPSNAPALAAYQSAIANFGNDDLFIVTMHCDDVFTSPNLHALRDIGDRIRRIDGVRSIESIVETTVPKFDTARDLFSIARFIDEIPDEKNALSALRADSLSHPLFPLSLIGSGGEAAAINVALRNMTDGEFVRARINERIEEILIDYRTPTRRFYVTGRQHIKAEAYHIMMRDLLTLIPLALLVGALVGWIASGHPLTGTLAVAASAVATAWVFACIAATSGTLNIITLVLGPMLLCVGSVYGVHVIARFSHEATAYESIRVCIERVRAPVLLAGTTTVAGFAALATSTTPAIRELAALACVGIAVVTLLSLSVIPAMLSFGLIAADAGGRSGVPAVIDRALAACRRVAVEHAGATVAVWALLAAAAVAALPLIEIDTDYLGFFDARDRIRTDFTAIGDVLVGPVPVYVTVTGSTPGAFREPENLRALEQLQRRIEELPAVAAAMSAVDLLSQANRALEYDAPAAARIPDTKGAVSDLYLLIPKTRMRPFANANQSSANIVVRVGDSGSAAMRALEHSLHRTIAETRLPASLTAAVTGSAILLSHNADTIATNQLTAVAAATLTIFVLVSIAMRSVKLGALAIVPNVVPVLVFYGLLGCGAGTLSLPTSLLGCIALGIAVDDTAHFLVDYHRYRRSGEDPQSAAHRCIETLGRPIVVTSLMLSTGFLVLGLSGFATLRELGTLGAVTMFLCLCADLTLLPALLVRTRA